MTTSQDHAHRPHRPRPRPHRLRRHRTTARVERVVDGDTIVVRLDGRSERVRYIGVDTPESVKPGVRVQCFAKAAAAENRRLVLGRDVRLTYDAEARDRYGRLLAYVWRGDAARQRRARAAGLWKAARDRAEPRARRRAAPARLRGAARTPGVMEPLLDFTAHAHAPEHRRDRGRLLRGDRRGPRAAREAAPTRRAPRAPAPGASASIATARCASSCSCWCCSEPRSS